MAIVTHSLARPNHFDSEPSTADVAAHNAWADAPPFAVLEEFPVTDRFDDEAPELPESDWYEPEPFDRAWWVEQLAHLESQLPACASLPETYERLEAEIGVLRRSLVLRDVAEYLSASRVGGHDCREDGAAC